MRYSVHSRVVWICVALAVASAAAWAVPAVRPAVANKPKVLVAGQSTMPKVLVAGQSTMRRARRAPVVRGVALSNLQKAQLFGTAGVAVPNGITTKAKFTPSQPIIANQGFLNIMNAGVWASGGPTDDPITGWVLMQGGRAPAQTSADPDKAMLGHLKAAWDWWSYEVAGGSEPGTSTTSTSGVAGGSIVLGFLPSVANKPVLVVFNIICYGTDRELLGMKIPAISVFGLSAGGLTQTLVLQPGSHNLACIVTPTTTEMQYLMLLSTSGYSWEFDSVEVIVLN
jgi:hypothetical protein